MTTPIRILGIDPGLNGGYAVITSTGQLIQASHFPTHQIKKNGKNSTQLDGVALVTRRMRHLRMTLMGVAFVFLPAVGFALGTTFGSDTGYVQ